MRFHIFLFIFLMSETSYAQFDFLSAEEDMAFYADVMTNASENNHRIKAEKEFQTKFLVALKEKNSFSYPFDSLKWISKKAPVDQKFRLFTWELKLSNEASKYAGYIQFSDGRLVPLIDGFKNAEDLTEEFTADNWLGALYYDMMEMKPKDEEKYYLLFGVNRWSKLETRKLIDVLFFTKDGSPVFGRDVFKRFSKEDGEVLLNRLVFSYASDGLMTVKYNAGLEMIVHDNLIPKMSRITGQDRTFVSDGSYVGYSWDGSYWNRVDKIATQIMDAAPRPKPILDKRKDKKIFGN
jgi:hypothetical protein